MTSSQCRGGSEGRYASSSSRRRSVVGSHFVKPASFCRNTTSVPCTARTFRSVLCIKTVQLTSISDITRKSRLGGLKPKHMASAEHEPIMGVWGRATSGVQGQRVPGRGVRGAKPPEAESFFATYAFNNAGIVHRFSVCGRKIVREFDCSIHLVACVAWMVKQSTERLRELLLAYRPSEPPRHCATKIAKLTRWALRLMEFDLEWTYQPGIKN